MKATHLPSPDTDFFSLQLYARILAGGLAGFVAGVVMAIFFAAAYAFLGGTPSFPLKLVAATLLGDAATLPSASWGTVVVGFLLNAFASAFLGGVFASMLLPQQRSKTEPLWAAFYGVCLGLAMRFLILPTGLNLALVARMPLDVFLIGHLCFGAILGILMPRIERRLMKQEFEERAVSVQARAG